MGLLEDLKLEEESEAVEYALVAAASRFPLERQYKGALRFVLHVGRLLEAERKAKEAQTNGVVPSAEQGRGRVPTVRIFSSEPWETPGLKMWEKTLKYLEAHPRAPYTDMALALYAKVDDTTRANVRSQIDQLKKRGLVRAIADGVCEVIPEAERESTDEETAE